jgi:phospholipase D1/2
MATKKRAMLLPINPPLEGTDATVMLTLSGMRSGTPVKLEIHEAAEAHDGDGAADMTVGTLTGYALPFGQEWTLTVDEQGGATGHVQQPRADDPQRPRVVAVIIPKGWGSAKHVWTFPIRDNVTHENDTDVPKRRNWSLYVKMLKPAETESNRVPMAVIPFALGVGQGDKATYDWHADNKVTLYAHGAIAANRAGEAATITPETPLEKASLTTNPDAPLGAFTDMAKAIGEAKHFIFVSDWSFQPYFRIKREGGAVNPQTAGRLLVDAAKRGVLVGVLAWKHPTSPSCAPLDEHNNKSEERLRALAGGTLPENLLWRGTCRAGTYSHHQKFVVLDCDGGGGRRAIKAFFGGLDLTKGRWDWDAHVIDPGDEAGADFRKKQFVPVPGGDSLTYDDWYSAEFQTDSQSDDKMPREPWHDIHGCIAGPTAWDFVREWIGRWNYHGGSGDIGDHPVGDPNSDPNPTKKTKLVHDLYNALHDKTKFVQQNEPAPKGNDSDYPWSAQLLRSMVRPCWETDRVKGYENDFTWTLDGGFERSIQDAYLNAIGLAEQYVYIETQYFISSGKFWDESSHQKVRNELARALCDRIEDKKKKGAKFHVYIITPMYPEGAPVGGPDAAGELAGVPQTQRFFEWQTMQYMIKRLGPSWRTYLSFFFPVRNGPPKDPSGVLVGPNVVVFTDKDGKKTYGTASQDYLTQSDTQVSQEPLAPRKDRMRANNRYMVYVHSKLMLVDDQYAILGSANLNERSLAGDRDTEICVQLWPKVPARVDDCKKIIKKLRDHLFKEHFGSTGDPASFAATAQRNGDANYTSYALGKTIDTSKTGQCVSLPFRVTGDSLRLAPLPGVPEWSNEYVFDAGSSADEWKWWSRPGKVWSLSDVAE